MKLRNIFEYNLTFWVTVLFACLHFPTGFGSQEKFPDNNRTCDNYQPSFAALDYWFLGHCTFRTNEALFIILLILWFLFLIYLLVSTTEDYFCAAISRISERLQLSNNLIGVTFLAIGNCAPEVMTTVIAIQVFGSYYGEAEEELGGSGGYIAVATLIGSAMLCTTLLLAILAFFTDARKQLRAPNLFPGVSLVRRPSLRDMVMYLIAILSTVLVLTTEWRLLYKGIFLISLYIAYFVLILVARHIYQTRKRQQRKAVGILDNAEDELLEMGNGSDPYRIDDILYFTNRHQPRPVAPATRYTFAEEYSFSESSSCGLRCLKSFYWTLAAIGWQEKSWRGKLAFIITLPVNTLRVFTIPPVSEYSWNKLHACAAAFGSPLLLLFALNSIIGKVTLSENIALPLWGAAVVIGLIAALIVYCSVKDEEPPKHFMIFVISAFIMSSVWLYIIVREILGVVLLGIEMATQFHSISRYPSSLWGMHLLAWATGLQDFIANLLIASFSLPSMAVAASFAAPTLSLLIGLGIAFVIQGIKYFNVEQQQFIKIDNSLLVGFAFLTISAIASLIAVPASKFTLTRKYAVFLVLLYVAFVLVSVLTDFKVIFTTPFL